MTNNEYQSCVMLHCRDIRLTRFIYT